MRKIEKFIKCNGCNVAIVGKGKNPTLYFIESWMNVYYPENDFDSIELPFKAGVDVKYIKEWLLRISMKDFKKIVKEIEND